MDLRARASVLVHHPGTNHLAYELVAGLQAGGYACDFHTGFFYKGEGALARVVAALPPRLRARVERELRRRAHAGLDPTRVHLRPWPELAHIAIGRLGAGQNRLARVIGWRNELLDRAVAKAVRRDRPRVVVGHDGSALYAGRAAHEIGAAAILNQVVGHVAAAHDIFREEAVLAPEFAETMVTTPDWIVARHEAEIREADGILVPSDYVHDTLVARGAAPERIFVLPYGVDIERFRPAPREAGDTFRILFVGQLSQRKGIRYLLEAVKRLKLPKAELVLVGKMLGSESAFAPYRGVFGHVTHVPYHEVHRLFQMADIFVYPSLHEGSAFATYEALASGLPIVTTRNAGSVARDGQEGFIVPIRDVEALMDRIERLYRDKDLRAAMARAARRRAVEFTWARYRERLNLYIDSFALRRSA
ncbi:MAG TPA: glycosyltransferase family 4 protein [Alphaproteobacteria bacterium]|nr:glycosyltransferase family 4 protein [Alphaproteobacteria bacterium]